MNLSEQLQILIEKKDHIIKKLENLSDEEKKILIDFFSKKANLENKIDWNNKELTFDDFKDLMKPTKTEKKKKFQLNGIEELNDGVDYLEFETGVNNIRAYIPLDHDTSVKLASRYIGGVDGQWCTAQHNDDSYFNSYCGSEHGYGVLIYFITPETKYAVLDTEYDVEIFNAEDSKIRKGTFEDETGLDLDDLLDDNRSIIYKARGKFEDMFPYESTEEYGVDFENYEVPETTERSDESIIYTDCRFFRCNGSYLDLNGSETLWTNKSSDDYIEPQEYREPTLFDKDDDVNESVINIYESMINEDDEPEEEEKQWGILSDTSWSEGTFDGGVFDDGKWYEGTWLNGDFSNSIWYSHGVFENGSITDNSEFNNGTIRYADIDTIDFIDGLIEDCVWRSGTFNSGKWKAGEWMSGRWISGEIYSEKYGKYIDSSIDPKQFYMLELKSKSIEELKEMVG